MIDVTPKNLKVGDTIRCKNRIDAVGKMYDLLEDGIDTDFVYEINGIQGLWLEVKKVEE